MKFKTLLTAATAALMLFASCQQSHIEGVEPSRGGETVTFTASTEQSAETRTSLSVGTTTTQVHWSDAEVVRVWSDAGYGDFTATVDDTDKTKATFTGKAPAGTLLSAIYPAESGGAADKVFFPEFITYKANNVVDGAMPMYAQVSDFNSPIAFKNLAGVVNIKLKGTEIVKNIKITSADIITGEATIAYNDGDPTVAFTEGGKTITLDCSAEPNGGVQLNAENATSFYITVPPTTAQSFSIEVNTTFGERMTRKTPESSSNQIERGMIINMPELTFAPAYEFEYIFSSGGSNTASVRGLASGFNAGAADLVIPSYVMSGDTKYTVTGIEASAFSNNTEFTGKLILPETLTTIGEAAFSGCSGFTGDLIIPQNVIEISWGAFEKCSGFDGMLSLPDALTAIRTSAFTDCSGFTGDLTLPDGLSLLDGNAFDGCSGFNGSLTLPSTLKTIEADAFTGCSGFTGDLVIPQNIIGVGERAFENCSGFTGDLVIPEGLGSLGYAALKGCSGLNGALDLPSTVKYISSEAFMNCNFVAITSRATQVPTLAIDAFSNESFTLTIAVPVGLISNYRDSNNWSKFAGYGEIGEYKYTYDETNNTATVTGPKDPLTQYTVITIPSTVMKDGKQYTVTAIGKEAFSNTTYPIGRLSLPTTLTTIGDNAFYNCTGLSYDLVIPEGVKTIGNNAFNFCQGLSGILSLPSTLEVISSYAFYNCGGLIGNLDIPEGVKEIQPHAFSGCSGFAGTLSLPQTMTSIGSFAFSWCKKLTGGIVLPAGLTTIENNIFDNCIQLTGDIIIPEGVTTIKYGAFNYCSNLRGRLVIPSTVTKIEERAFFYCNFTDITSRNSTPPTLGDEAFKTLNNTIFDLTVKVPGNSTTDYEVATNWSSFAGFSAIQ